MASNFKPKNMKVCDVTQKYWASCCIRKCPRTDLAYRYNRGKPCNVSYTVCVQCQYKAQAEGYLAGLICTYGEGEN